MRRAASILCVLSGLNLLGVLLTARRGVTIGSIHLFTHSLRTALLPVFVSTLAVDWARGKRTGIRASSRLQSPFCLFVLLALLYTLPVRSAMPSGDVIPARYLPLSILREFNLDLNEFTDLYRPRIPYFLQEIGGRIVSAYPPWAALLAVPVYLVPVLGGISADSPFLAELERLTAALVTALSAIVLFAALRRLTRKPVAWSVALLYALGTSSLSVSSQELWQHGPAQLWLALTVYFLVRGIREPKAVPAAAGSLAMAIITRPSNLLIALPIGVYILMERRYTLRSCLLWALPPSLLFFGYNSIYFGSPFATGFGSFVMRYGLLLGDFTFFGNPVQSGLMGLLFSPARGLLIYSPVLIFAVCGMILVWRSPGPSVLRYLSLSPLPLLVVAAKWGMWWGGHSYGPRLLADLLPILCLFLYPVLEAASTRSVLKYAVAGLAVLSVGLHGLGTVSNGSWNRVPLDVDRHPERLWSWTKSPPVYYLKQFLEPVVASASPDPSWQQRQTTDRLRRFLVRVHREAFDLDPGSDWLAFWIPFLRSRCDVSGIGKLADAVFDSNELWAVRPLPPGTLATVLYRAFLGRNPDPPGLAYWEARIRAAGARLAWEGFLPTFRKDEQFFDGSDQADVRAIVRRFYVELLGRDPDQAGLAFWVNDVRLSHDLSKPTAVFLNSDEFGRRALPLRVYTPLLYRVFWGRDPDRMTMAFWGSRLQTDLFDLFRSDFLAADELQRAVREICDPSGAVGTGAR